MPSTPDFTGLSATLARLENWGRAEREPRKSAHCCRSIEHRYDRTDDPDRHTGAVRATPNRIDLADAERVSQAWRALPSKPHARALVQWFVHRSDLKACKALGCNFRALGDEMRRAVEMIDSGIRHQGSDGNNVAR
jgi:hypothetical protein